MSFANGVSTWYVHLKRRFATSKSKLRAEQFIVYKELQREEVGARKGTEGTETDEHASRSVTRQDDGRPRLAEACADAITQISEQLHRWTATVCMWD